MKILQPENNSTLVQGKIILAFYILAVTAGLFVGGLWAYAGIGGGISLFICAAIQNHKITWTEKYFSLLALLFFAIVALENFSSLSPRTSWHEELKLVTIFVPLLIFFNLSSPAHILHPRFFVYLFTATLVGTMALSAELALSGPVLHVIKGTDASLTQYNRGLSLLMVMAFPLMAGLLYGNHHWQKIKPLWVVLFFIAVLFIPAGLTESRAAKLALLLGMVVLCGARVMPVVTHWMLAVLAFACIGWPLAAQQFFLYHYDALKHFPDSWRARMEIWDYMSYRILEKPVTGWGLGTAHLLDFADPHGAQYQFITFPAAHPHNVFVQLWLELGLPGLALGLAFALLVLYKASQLEKKLVPFAMASWIAAFSLSCTAYDFWTDSFFSAFALTGFIFVMLNKKEKPHIDVMV